jgi:hypothetical protein
MKVLLSILLVTATAKADFYKDKTVYDCRVYRMYDMSYFEEGLSTQEYTDIEVHRSEAGEWSTQYGSHEPQEAGKGYQISVEDKGETEGTTVVTSVSEHGDVLVFEIEQRRSMALAKVKVKEQGKSKFKTLGLAMCNTGSYSNQ